MRALKTTKSRQIILTVTTVNYNSAAANPTSPTATPPPTMPTLGAAALNETVNGVTVELAGPAPAGGEVGALVVAGHMSLVVNISMPSMVLTSKLATTPGSTHPPSERHCIPTPQHVPSPQSVASAGQGCTHTGTAIGCCGCDCPAMAIIVVDAASGLSVEQDTPSAQQPRLPGAHTV